MNFCKKAHLNRAHTPLQNRNTTPIFNLIKKRLGISIATWSKGELLTTLLLKVEIFVALSSFAHPQICSRKLVIKRILHSWTVALARIKGRKTSMKKLYSRHQWKHTRIFILKSQNYIARYEDGVHFFYSPNIRLLDIFNKIKMNKFEKSPEILKISSHWRIRDKLRWIIFCCCKNDGQRTWCAVSW